MVPEDTRVKLLIGLSAPGQLDLFGPAVQVHDSSSPPNFHPPVVARMCHDQLLANCIAATGTDGGTCMA